jgi:hypothetical protein
MNQFVYTRTEGEKKFKDSFNINKVIRSMEIEDGKRIVVLDDFHERVEQVPDINPKTNKVMGVRRERTTFQSEIYLDVEDAKKFSEICEIK